MAELWQSTASSASSAAATATATATTTATTAKGGSGSEMVDLDSLLWFRDVCSVVLCVGVGAL